MIHLLAEINLQSVQQCIVAVIKTVCFMEIRIQNFLKANTQCGVRDDRIGDLPRNFRELFRIFLCERQNRHRAVSQFFREFDNGRLICFKTDRRVVYAGLLILWPAFSGDFVFAFTPPKQTMYGQNSCVLCSL